MSKRVTQDQVQSDYFAALDRLASCKPKNAALKAKVETGTLRINPTTVALEAGRSRTPIAHDGTKYQGVRDAIRGLSKRPAAGRNNSADNSDATTTEVDLKARIDMLVSINAALIIKAGLKPADLEQPSPSDKVLTFPNRPKRS